MRIVAAAAFAALAALSGEAQGQVSATIVIPGGPVAGHIRIGDPPRRHVELVRVRPRGREVIFVERHAPRVIVVERFHRKHPRFRHLRHDRLERRVVFYDPYDRRYYDRPYRGLVEVHVFAHQGRYYRYDRADWRDDRRGRDRDWYRDDRRRRGGDRWEDRR